MKWLISPLIKPLGSSGMSFSWQVVFSRNLGTANPTSIVHPSAGASLFSLEFVLIPKHTKQWEHGCFGTWGGTYDEGPWRCFSWCVLWSLLGQTVLPHTLPRVASCPWLLSSVLSQAWVGLLLFCWTTAFSDHSLGQTSSLLNPEPCPRCLSGLGSYHLHCWHLFSEVCLNYSMLRIILFSCVNAQKRKAQSKQLKTVHYPARVKQFF